MQGPRNGVAVRSAPVRSVRVCGGASRQRFVASVVVCVARDRGRDLPTGLGVEAVPGQERVDPLSTLPRIGHSAERPFVPGDEPLGGDHGFAVDGDGVGGVGFGIGGEERGARSDG